MFFNSVPRGMVFIFIFLLFSYVLEMDALARFGGGSSMGSRGSRSFSMPSSPSSAPTSPSSPYNYPAPGPTGSPLPQQPGGGFLRGIAGGIMGGMLGGMLFRGLGFGGNGMGGGGFGLFEIVLIGLEAEELKRNKRINRLENIAVRSVDITEAWQEEGKDFINHPHPDGM